MKRILSILILLATPLLLVSYLTSCDDDDDLSTSEVPSAVLTTFNLMYSDAVSTKWEKDTNYYKAEFYNSAGNEVDAWFIADGTWIRSETDILPADLPQAVQNYVATNYPDYYIDDAEYIQTTSSSYYLLELEAPSAPDVYLKVLENGTLFQ